MIVLKLHIHRNVNFHSLILERNASYVLTDIDQYPQKLVISINIVRDEAARIAYTNGQYMRKYLDSKINDIAEINKCFRPIWELTYRIVSGEEKRSR
jgi:hypothetical protein